MGDRWVVTETATGTWDWYEAVQSTTQQSRAEQSRTEQNRAGQGQNRSRARAALAGRMIFRKAE